MGALIMHKRFNSASLLHLGCCFALGGIGLHYSGWTNSPTVWTSVKVSREGQVSVIFNNKWDSHWVKWSRKSASALWITLVWPLMEGWEEATELEEGWFSPSCRSRGSNRMELAARKRMLMNFYVLWVMSQSCDLKCTCLQSWPLSGKLLIGKRDLQEYSNKRRGWYLCNGQNTFSQLTAMFSPHQVFLPNRYLEVLVIVFPSSTLEVDYLA